MFVPGCQCRLQLPWYRSYHTCILFRCMHVLRSDDVVAERPSACLFRYLVASFQPKHASDACWEGRLYKSIPQYKFSVACGLLICEAYLSLSRRFDSWQKDMRLLLMCGRVCVGIGCFVAILSNLAALVEILFREWVYISHCGSRSLCVCVIFLSIVHRGCESNRLSVFFF